MCVDMHMCMQVPMETDEDGGVSGPGAADRSYLICCWNLIQALCKSSGCS